MAIRQPQALKDALTEIPSGSPQYPAAWQSLPDKPASLFAFGDVSLLKERKLGVVGSRRTPVNALKLGTEICKVVSERFVLVTGTADGGDSAAIEGALAGSGKVICLLAGGFSSLPQFNLELLRKVVKRGLLLSPHPFETEVRAYSYEYRNKLLAALSDGVFVLGAGEKSGALITAKYAAQYEKPTFAFPYPPNSSTGAGCNRMIKRGAHLVECAEDILSHYGLEPVTPKRQATLSEEEGRVYAVLQEAECHVSELAAKSGLPAYKLRGILSALEVKGLVVPLGGNRFAAL